MAGAHGRPRPDLQGTRRRDDLLGVEVRREVADARSRRRLHKGNLRGPVSRQPSRHNGGSGHPARSDKHLRRGIAAEGMILALRRAVLTDAGACR